MVCQNVRFGGRKRYTYLLLLRVGQAGSARGHAIAGKETTVGTDKAMRYRLLVHALCRAVLVLRTIGSGLARHRGVVLCGEHPCVLRLHHLERLLLKLLGLLGLLGRRSGTSAWVLLHGGSHRDGRNATADRRSVDAEHRGGGGCRSSGMC